MGSIMTGLKKNELNKPDVLKILNTLEMVNYTIQRELSVKARKAWNLECALIGIKNDISMIRRKNEQKKTSESVTA